MNFIADQQFDQDVPVPPLKVTLEDLKKISTRILESFPPKSYLKFDIGHKNEKIETDDLDALAVDDLPPTIKDFTLFIGAG